MNKDLKDIIEFIKRAHNSNYCKSKDGIALDSLTINQLLELYKKDESSRVNIRLYLHNRLDQKPYSEMTSSGFGYYDSIHFMDEIDKI